MEIKVNDEEVENPVLRFFYAIFALFVTGAVLAMVGIALLSPFWLPLYLLGVIP